MISRISLLAGPLLLAGCAADSGAYPSLAPRAVEGRSDAEPVAAVEEPVPADAAVSTRIANALAAARKGEADFDAAYPAAQRVVNAGRKAAVSSEAWVAAQSQLSVLDAARAPTAQALTEISELYAELIDRAGKGEAVGGIADVTAAQTQIEAIYSTQVERLDRLRDTAD